MRPQFFALDFRGKLLLWILGTGLLLVLTVTELQRLERGKLFLLALPHDAPPTRYEIADARQSVNGMKLPACGAVFLVCLIPAITARFPSANLEPPRWRWIMILGIAALADLLTTLIFFHRQGIDFEAHPAIRLFGYAYGRTSGPILAKLLQFGLIVVISRWSRRYGLWLLGGTTLFWSAGAIYNIAVSE